MTCNWRPYSHLETYGKGSAASLKFKSGVTGRGLRPDGSSVGVVVLGLRLLTGTCVLGWILPG